MTRWARGGPSNKKKPHDASLWSDLSQKTKKSQATPCEERRDTGDVRFKSKQTFKSKATKQKLRASKANSSGGQSSSRDVLKAKWKNEKRREFRRKKREKKREDHKVCFNCRETGHLLADCPQLTEDVEQGTGICFKCGSTEHSSNKCFVKLPPGKFPYAKCFICGETGHLSRQCPDNPRGLYPNGGCCKGCGSVEHLKRDCPELQKKQGIGDMTLETMDSTKNVEEVTMETNKPSSKQKKAGPKTVKF